MRHRRWCTPLRAAMLSETIQGGDLPPQLSGARCWAVHSCSVQTPCTGREHASKRCTGHVTVVAQV